MAWLNSPGAGMSNSPGIRPVRFAHNLGTDLPAFLVLITFPKGPSHSPWEDLVDHSSARVTYWGDAKFDARRSYDDFRGNQALRRVWDAILDNRHPWIPPVLHFTKPQSGKVEFSGLCVLEHLELTWFVDKGKPVKNYRCHLGILDVDSVDPAWLRGRALATSQAELKDVGPDAWQAYQNGLVQRMDVFKGRVRSTKDQLPIPNSPDDKVLDQLIGLSPSLFEAAVVSVFRKWEPVTHWIEQTRPTADGGFDFVGRFRLSAPLDYEINFRGEAKRFARTTAVDPKAVSRLVARLGRGEYGIFVTTSFFTKQAQREVLEDRYPVRLMSGLDLVGALRELRLASGAGLDPAWLELLAPAQRPGGVPKAK
jgi:hypothetical protein